MSPVSVVRSRSTFRFALPFGIALLAALGCERNTVVVTEKTPPVRDLVIDDPRDGVHLNLSWTKPSGENLRGVRILRRAGEPPLSATDSFAQVAYEGAAEKWSDEGYDGAATKTPLVVGTTYHYAAYALYGENEFSSPARAEKTLHFFGPVRSFTAEATDAGPVQLSWVIPDPKGDIVSVKVERSRVAAPGTPSAADTKVIYEGTETTKRDDGAVSGTHYFYAIRTFDAAGTASERVTADATTRPGQVKNLRVTATSGGRIELSWTNPADERFSAARVVRKAGADPANPNDRDVVCDAPGGTACTDKHPDPSSEAHYGVYAHDAEGDFASGVFGHANAVDPVTAKVARSFGGTGGDWVKAVATATDGAIVVGGRVGYGATSDRSASFGTSSSPLDTSSRGSYGDGFVVRYLADGTPSWLRTIGSTAAPGDATSEVTSLAVLSDGSVLAAGKYFNVGVFSGGGVSVTLQPFGPACAGYACSDAFVEKFSASGTLQWVKRIGVSGSYGDETVFSIVPRSDGGAIIAGVWDPRAAGARLSLGDGSGSTSLGAAGQGFDPFVARFDANGNFAWARTAGGSGPTSVDHMVAVAAPGGVLLAAEHNGAVTLGGFSVAGRGHVLASLSDAGDFSWVEPISVFTNGQIGPAVGVLANGDIILSGRLYGVGTFGSGADAVQLGADEQDAGYIARYTGSGHLLGAELVAATFFQADAILPQPDGGYLLSGMFSGTFTAGTGIDRLSVGGQANTSADDHAESMFLARFDAAGAPVWLRTNGTAGQGYSAYAALHGSHEVVVAGSFSGDAQFFQNGAHPVRFHDHGSQSASYFNDDGFLLVLDDAAP